MATISNCELGGRRSRWHESSDHSESSTRHIPWSKDALSGRSRIRHPSCSCMSCSSQKSNNRTIRKNTPLYIRATRPERVLTTSRRALAREPRWPSLRQWHPGATGVDEANSLEGLGTTEGRNILASPYDSNHEGALWDIRLGTMAFIQLCSVIVFGSAISVWLSVFQDHVHAPHSLTLSKH